MSWTNITTKVEVAQPQTSSGSIKGKFAFAVSRFGRSLLSEVRGNAEMWNDSTRIRDPHRKLTLGPNGWAKVASCVCVAYNVSPNLSGYIRLIRLYSRLAVRRLLGERLGSPASVYIGGDGTATY